MAKTATATLPANIPIVHIVATGGDYYRFGESGVTSHVERLSQDDTAFSSTSITFSVAGNNVTITKPAAITEGVHVVLSNGHYYRFERAVNTLALQQSSDSSLFASISLASA